MTGALRGNTPQRGERTRPQRSEDLGARGETSPYGNDTIDRMIDKEKEEIEI